MALKGTLVARSRLLKEAAMRGVVKATEEVRNEAISLILNTPKTGRIYHRRSVTHQASAPGQPPASDTGQLVNSIQTRYDSDTLTGTVVATAPYAAHLEYGTRNMEPRPFLRPAFANRRRASAAIIRAEMAKVK